VTPTGAFVQGGVRNVPAFEAWLGGPLAVAHDFTAFDIPDWWLKAWGSSWYAQRMMATLPMLPKDSSGKIIGTLEQGAAGAFDGQWKANARRLVAAGMARSALRVGHEANGPWCGWYAKPDPKAWLAYYRRIVHAARSVPGSRLRAVWSMSCGWSGFDPLSIYDPAVVDIIAVDFYDSHYAHPDDTPEQRWATIYEANHHGGLEFWTNFARQQGKPLWVTETGLVNVDAVTGDGTSRGGGGDDPYFVQQLHDWAAANADVVKLICYENADAADGKHRLDTGRYPRGCCAVPKPVREGGRGMSPRIARWGAVRPCSWGRVDT
jgi:hypothetical protein